MKTKPKWISKRGIYKSEVENIHWIRVWDKSEERNRGCVVFNAILTCLSQRGSQSNLVILHV